MFSRDIFLYAVALFLFMFAYAYIFELVLYPFLTFPLHGPVTTT